MITSGKTLILCALLLGLVGCKNKAEEKKVEALVLADKKYQEAYRPQFHFSPQEKWMNDPNGLVYYEGTYHLFYQYYPGDIVWGPMHWGHATSKDMVFWEHQPIALYPDEKGLIFSGSAVVDKNNSSGFGTKDKPPLVAVFTYHNMDGEKEGRKDFQTQGIAYSLDKGQSWMKYINNPVIGNEGIKDFRDPKVFWHEETQNWIMILVAGDHAKLYRSKNLKDWEYLSEFGKEVGAHGGVWECPDLFPLSVDETGEEKWVLIISINPGAPNGGSGTQYFVGNFDGQSFTSNQKDPQWLDWGTDNYAGVTYNNEPNNDRIFIGWMSNWDYARDTPTEKWRSAMTVARKLSLSKAENTYELKNYPLENFGTIFNNELQRDIALGPGEEELLTYDNFNQAEVRFETAAKDFVLSFKNQLKEELTLTLSSEQQLFLLDRVSSGKTDFQENFGNKIQQMPIPDLPDEPFEVRILLDWSSIEIFINGGQYVMTAQVFPNQKYNSLDIQNSSDLPIKLEEFEINGAETIW